MATVTIGNRIITSLLCVVLAACGGGGGGGETTSSVSPGTGTGSTGTTGTSGNNGTPGTTGAGSGNASSPANNNQPAPVVGGVSTTEAPSSGNTDNSGTTPPPATQADATQARFNRPFGITRDAAGNLFVADSFNHTIRKITPAGNVRTLAGSPGASGNVDGTGAAARFSFPTGITVDGAGNVYVLDNATVRRVTPAGVVTTIAGAAGESGDTDGPGVVARFNRPLFGGIVADPAGNVYVADTNNYLIRRVGTDGIVTTYAGTRGSRGSANGSASSATFIGPVGLAIDSAGNLLVADMLTPPAPNIPEGSTLIRRIGTDGTVTTVAGNLGSENGPAQFISMYAITVDATGNVYAINRGQLIRITPTGVISTVASVFGDGITRDDNGNFYVTSNSAITRVAADGSTTVIAGQPGQTGSTDVP